MKKSIIIGLAITFATPFAFAQVKSFECPSDWNCFPKTIIPCPIGFYCQRYSDGFRIDTDEAMRNVQSSIRSNRSESAPVYKDEFTAKQGRLITKAELEKTQQEIAKKIDEIARAYDKANPGDIWNDSLTQANASIKKQISDLQEEYWGVTNQIENLVKYGSVNPSE